MKLFKVKSGIVIQVKDSYYLLKDYDWDDFINDDNIISRVSEIIHNLQPISYGSSLIEQEILPPIQSQEVWASGVTYYKSKRGREEESKEAGGADFYNRVYHAERPELFFKATASRTVGHGGYVRIRQDSSWDVPEPELTLVITASGKIIGYTIGNDMSSRSIEGENPLYLPQAKTYDGSAALGPCIYLTDGPLPSDTEIILDIRRSGKSIFYDKIQINQIKRTFVELVSFLFRECSFPHGCFLMTGTGIVPPADFTLQNGDEIYITIEPIGTLYNVVS